MCSCLSPSVGRSLFDCAEFLTLYQCKLCYFSINEKSHYLSHKCNVRDKSEVTYYNECEQCNIGSNSILWTFLHQRTHFIQKNIRRVDEKSFDKIFKCNQCRFTTTTNYRLKCHSAIMHVSGEETVWFKCEKCDFKTKYKYHLASHIKCRHPIEKNEYKCNECSYQTHVRQNLQRHVNVHKPKHLLQWYSCPSCTFKSIHKVSLQKHITAKHIKDDQAIKFTCHICQLKLKSRGNLINHLKGRHAISNVWYKCNECSYKTWIKQLLEDHVVSKHTPEDQIKWNYCTLCSYKSKVYTILKVHMKKKHSLQNQANTKRHNCTNCNYKTDDLLNLKTHLKEVHLVPENRYECEHCLYRTNLKKNFTRHMLQHIPDDRVVWHSCEHCTYKSKYSHVVKTHVIAKHDVGNKLKCGQCSFKTARQSLLRKHITSKHIQDNLSKWLYCKDCSYKSKNIVKYNSHRKRMHFIFEEMHLIDT